MYIWKNEHPVLVLPESCRAEAEALQNASMADDGKIGIIEEYLKGKQRVCAIQIWQEALGEEGRPQKWQATEINDIVARIPDWKRLPKAARFGAYGAQKGFQRVTLSVTKDVTNKEIPKGFEPVGANETSKTPFD